MIQLSKFEAFLFVLGIVLTVVTFIHLGNRIIQALRPAKEEFMKYRDEKSLVHVIEALGEYPETIKGLKENSHYLRLAYADLSKKPKGRKQILEMIQNKLLYNNEKLRAIVKSLEG